MKIRCHDDQRIEAVETSELAAQVSVLVRVGAVHAGQHEVWRNTFKNKRGGRVDVMRKW